MDLVWHDKAWDAYVEYQTKNKKLIKKANDIIKNMQRTPFEGLGKPEPLKGDLSGLWSRRLDDGNRIIYRLNKSNQIDIVEFAGHYGDK